MGCTNCANGHRHKNRDCFYWLNQIVTSHPTNMEVLTRGNQYVTFPSHV